MPYENAHHERSEYVTDRGESKGLFSLNPEDPERFMNRTEFINKEWCNMISYNCTRRLII